MPRTVRVGETNPDFLKMYFEVVLLDLKTPAIGEAGGTPQISINGGGWNSVGISQLVAVSYGRYYATLSSGIITTPGDEILSRYQSAITAESFGDTVIVVAANGSSPSDVSVTYYGSVTDGDSYFANSLRGAAWKAADPETRLAALNDATQVIDKLNFAGDKADDQQLLQFPRGNTYVDPFLLNTRVIVTTDVNIPWDIKRAAYLIADKLLDGWDPDMEADNLASQSSKYAGVTTSYNREYIPEHMRAGIPSAQAWGLLRPYVRDTHEVDLTRMN